MSSTIYLFVKLPITIKFIEQHNNYTNIIYIICFIIMDAYHGEYEFKLFYIFFILTEGEIYF